jgi:hypothetical protein
MHIAFIQPQRLCILSLAAVALVGQQRNPHTTAADADAGAKIFRSHALRRMPRLER